MTWRRSSFCETGACVEVDMEWKKSSFCSANGCLEVGADWVKSTASAANGNCVEVRAPHESVIYVRDSKDPGGPVLRFNRDEWSAFLAGARAGEFDL